MSPEHRSVLKVAPRSGNYLPTISESEVHVSCIPTGGAVVDSEPESEGKDAAEAGAGAEVTSSTDPDLLEDLLLPDSTRSIGSLKHPHCTPCIYTALRAGGVKSAQCSAGIGCEYCHFPHPMTKKDLLKRLRMQVRVGASNS